MNMQISSKNINQTIRTYVHTNGGMHVSKEFFFYNAIQKFKFEIYKSWKGTKNWKIATKRIFILAVGMLKNELLN